MVLRKVILATKVSRHGKLAAKWEGPYMVTRVSRPETYYLRTPDGMELMRPWNIQHLKRYITSKRRVLELYVKVCLREIDEVLL